MQMLYIRWSTQFRHNATCIKHWNMHRVSNTTMPEFLILYEDQIERNFHIRHAKMLGHTDTLSPKKIKENS